MTIAWPKHVIFPQYPILCRWDDEQKNWTKTHIHQVAYDTEKGSINFRTAVFGIFSFATLRYYNLPYTNWRIRPEKNESVTVKIVSPIVRMDFNITGGLICLSLLYNCSENILETVKGKYLKLSRLKRCLKAAGLDIFPGTFL